MLTLCKVCFELYCLRIFGCIIAAIGGQGRFSCHCTRWCQRGCCPYCSCMFFFPLNSICDLGNHISIFVSNIQNHILAKSLSFRFICVVLQINSEGVTRNYYPGDKLPLWHEELEPQNSLLDILNSASPEPMNTQ